MVIQSIFHHLKPSFSLDNLSLPLETIGSCRPLYLCLGVEPGGALCYLLFTEALYVLLSDEALLFAVPQQLKNEPNEPFCCGLDTERVSDYLAYSYCLRGVLMPLFLCILSLYSLLFCADKSPGKQDMIIYSSMLRPGRYTLLYSSRRDVST